MRWEPGSLAEELVFLATVQCSSQLREVTVLLFVVQLFDFWNLYFFKMPQMWDIIIYIDKRFNTFFLSFKKENKDTLTFNYGLLKN